MHKGKIVQVVDAYGHTYAGVVLNAENYGTQHEPDWYIEFTREDNGQYSYTKQKIDYLKSVDFFHDWEAYAAWQEEALYGHQYDPSQRGVRYVFGQAFTPLTQGAVNAYNGILDMKGPHWQFETPGGMTTLLWSEGEKFVGEYWIDDQDNLKYREWRICNESDAPVVEGHDLMYQQNDPTQEPFKTFLGLKFQAITNGTMMGFCGITEYIGPHWEYTTPDGTLLLYSEGSGALGEVPGDYDDTLVMKEWIFLSESGNFFQESYKNIQIPMND